MQLHHQRKLIHIGKIFVEVLYKNSLLNFIATLLIPPELQDIPLHQAVRRLIEKIS